MNLIKADGRVLGVFMNIKGIPVKVTTLLASSALLLAAAMPNSMAATAMSTAQKADMEKMIHDYIVSHPEVLVEASQALQQKQQQDMQMQAQSAIGKNAGQLFTDQMTVAGNPKGNVTLVEFFDYQCIHCKKMAPVISSLIKKDNNLKVVYKEFPIFGESSELASKAALAAAMQGKYAAMHDALLGQEQRLNAELINKAAESIGLDMAKFKTDMAGKQVSDALQANRVLAEELHLMGTPAFIIASTPNGQFKAGSKADFIPGAATEEALQSLIKKAQQK